MYTYAAGATGLDASCRPGCRRAGTRPGSRACATRRPRARRRRDRRAGRRLGEHLPRRRAERMLLVGFKNPALKPLTGRTLAEVAARAAPARGDRDRPGDRGRQPGGDGLFHHGRGQRAARNCPGSASAPTRVSLAPEGVFLQGARIRAPSVLSPACSATMSATRAGAAGRRDPPLAGLPAANLSSTARALAPGMLPTWWSSTRRDHRPCHVCRAAAVRHRRGPRLRQRRAGAARRRTHRCEAGPGGVAARARGAATRTHQSQLATDPEAGVPVERQGGALAGKESAWSLGAPI